MISKAGGAEFDTNFLICTWIEIWPLGSLFRLNNQTYGDHEPLQVEEPLI